MGVSSGKDKSVGNAIPTKQREMVKVRSRGQCERCLGRGADIHHRQRRREGGHNIENLVHLCRTCHSWVHSHPVDARVEGFIISASMTRDGIGAVPIVQFNKPIFLSTDGRYVGSPTIKEAE